MGKKIFVIVFGIVFAAAGVFMLIKGNDMAKRCTAEVSGSVVEVIAERNDDTDSDSTIVIESYTYYPVIEYKAGDKRVNKKYNVGYGDKNKYKVGDRVDVLYDPNKVEDYLIKGDKSSNVFGYAFIAAGALVAVLGIVKKEF